DGSEQLVATDDSWQFHASAICHADLLMGECQDLRLEPGGWDGPGFDASDWLPVEARDRDGGPLVADPGPPVRVTQELAPQHISRDAAGRHIVDFGQNLTGWLSIRITGAAGARIRVRHGEALAGDGSLYTENLRRARQADEYITAGGAEILEPRF